MKISKYNKIVALDDGRKIAFNSMSCVLREVDDDFLGIINNIESIKYDELEEQKKLLVDEMINDNFIIHDYVDEIKMIKFKHLNAKFSMDKMSVTIAPTLMCNFQCPYCFETPKNGVMQDEVSEATSNALAQIAKVVKSIRIVWYGGEPLIAMDAIYKISTKVIQACEENGTRYSAFIVTNGYLIDDEIIEKLKVCRITSAQITLDGPPDVHNSRRKLKGDSKGTFDVILNNTKKLAENGIYPSIRINIDKTNKSRVEELLEILKNNELNSFPVDFGQILSLTEACASIAESCLTTKEFAEETLKNQEMLYNHGFNVSAYYPRSKSTYCTADLSSSVIIDTNGFLYKCWNDVGNEERAVGNIIRSEYTMLNEKMHCRNIDYILRSPFNYRECIDCYMLPICMGGCPYVEQLEDEKANCETWKYNLDDVLKLTYLQRGNITQKALRSIGEN